MGRFLLQLCPWVTILATLGCAASLEGDTDYRRADEVALGAQDICPCIARAECPRILGTKPEDALLGSFPPCEITDTVRCCGVTTSVSVQHSVSDGLPSGTVKLPGYLEQRSQAGSLRYGSGVQEGVGGEDEETGEYYLVDEFSDEGSEADGQADDDERGKSIDSGISQADASQASDFLDYRGVSKHPAADEEVVEVEDGGRNAGATDHGRGQQRGKISSSEKTSLTSTSSSSSVGKVERVVTSRKETVGRLTQVRGENLVEVSHANGRLMPGSLDGGEIIEPEELTESETKGLRVIPVTLTKTAGETKTNEEKVGASEKKSSAADEQQDVAVENSYEANDYPDDNNRLGTREGEETTLKNHQETSSRARQESSKTTRETSSFEESGSSSFTGNDQQQRKRLWEGRTLGGSTRPTARISQAEIESRLTDESVLNELAEMSRQQRSKSEMKESSHTEESSSSSSKTVLTNTNDSTDKATTSEIFGSGLGSISEIGTPTIFRRPTLVPKVAIAYGENRETSSQQRSQSVKKESSKVEKTLSTSQIASTNREGVIDADINSEHSDVTLGPVSTFQLLSLSRRPSVGLRDNTAYVQRDETASQQLSDSSKTESSKVEKMVSTSQIASTNREEMIDANVSLEESDVTLGQVSTFRRPSLSRRPSLGIKDNTAFLQREETASQQSSDSSKTESSKVEKIMSTSQMASMDREKEIDANLSLDDSDLSLGQVSTFRRPSLSRRPSVGLRGNTAYVQQEETASQQSSDSSKTESSKVEKTSSTSQIASTNREGVIDANINSEDSDVTLGQVSTFRRPSLSRRPSVGLRDNTAYVQRDETASQQSSDSSKTESSKVEKMTSTSQIASTNREGVIDANINSEDSDVTLGQVSTFRRPSLSRRPSVGLRDNTAYVQRDETASQQSSDSSKTESSKVEKMTSTSQIASTNREGVIDANINSEDSDVTLGQVSTFRRPSLSRRPSVGLRDNTAYVQRDETASQQSSDSSKTESSKVEKTSSTSQIASTNREGVIDANINSEDSDVTLGQVSTFRRPSLSRRPSVGLRDNTAYVQRDETASQQSSDSSKTESSKVEKMTSTSQIASTNREGVIDANINSEDSDVTLGQVSTFRRPSLSRRPSVGLRDNTAYVQRDETASQQSSDSSKTESSKVEKMTSTSQIASTNREGVIDANVNSEDSDVTLGQVSTFRRPSLSRRPSVGLKDNTAYVEGKGISSQESSNSSRTESSKVTSESMSSNSQTVTTNLKDLSENNVKSGDFDKTLKPLAEVRRLMPSRTPSLGLRGDMGYSELTEISSQQQSESVKEDSSKAEKIESSNVKSITTNTENLTNKMSNLGLKGGTKVKQSDVETAKEIMLNSKSESSSLKERENFAKQSSDTSRTSTASNLINVVTGKPVIKITDNPMSWQIAGHAYYPVLVNAGFLKDRPISTGPVGLDPLSGVTHSDLDDPELATELLPLSCGNVIFGERNTGGNMLLCDVPRPGDKPYQFLKGDTSAVSPEKLNGPELPGAILPETVLKFSQKPVRRRIIRKRPNGARKTLDANEDIREVGSKHVAVESVSTSSSTVKKASSLEESTFSPGSGKKITKARFDASSAENFDADGATSALNSKFYRVPNRPHQVTLDSSVAVEEEPAAIVEVVDSAPSTETKINRKRLRVSSSDDKLPRNDLEVLSIKTTENDGANVEEERFVRPAGFTGRPRFSFNRHSGRVQRDTISPDDISMSGRISVVGPIPAGYIDPALVAEDTVDIHLPGESVITNFRPQVTEQQQEAADRGLGTFKPSPVDPIQWP